MRAIVAAALATCTLTVLPAAAVTAAEPAPDNSCPAPRISDSYDPAERIVQVSLPATGCPTREIRRFPLSLRIERSDWSGSDGADRTVLCGPFRSGVEEGTTYSCEVELILAHPPEDEAEYAITVAYPGIDGEETATYKSVCTTDDQTAECEDEAQTLTGHGDREG